MITHYCSSEIGRPLEKKEYVKTDRQTDKQTDRQYSCLNLIVLLKINQALILPGRPVRKKKCFSILTLQYL